jgi:hypothetical protein
MKLTSKFSFVFAFALALIALSRSPFAQDLEQKRSQIPSQRMEHGFAKAGQFSKRSLPMRNFGHHINLGRLAWTHGHWHHEKRDHRYGWWWDVGGVGYFYPQPIEGPPSYVSDIVLAEDKPDAPPATDTSAAPPPPSEPHHVFYYRPGDFKGVPYNTIEECTNAVEKGGNIGVCVMK